MIPDLVNSGAMPALEQMVRFAAQRQRLIAHNIANLDTPNFIAQDVSPQKFQASLARAIAERRARTGGEHGELRVEDSREVSHGANGELSLHPRTTSGNILYHDRGNRDLERLMQDLSENGMAFRLASDLWKKHQDTLRTAISQRV